MSAKIDLIHEQGLVVVHRFVQLMRTSRTYAVGNQTFSRHLAELLAGLEPLLADGGDMTLAVRAGDVYLNGSRLPLRQKSLRFLEAMADELGMRRIHGLVFRPGVTIPELEAFMRVFVPSEQFKGAELAASCVELGLDHVAVLLDLEGIALDVEPAPVAPAEAPPALDENAPFGPALIAYEQALSGAERLFATGALEQGVEMRWVQRLVQPLADTIGTPEPATLVLVDIGHEDSGGTHAVHVTITALAIGHALGLARRELSDVGAAALLHDAGQPEIVRVLGSQMDHWSAADWKDAQQHTLLGVRRLAVATPLGPTALRAMRVALEHHVEDPQRASLLAQIVSCADAFVSVLAHRAMPGSTLTPYEALGRVLAGYGERWHPAVRIALVRGIGLYPPGQVVRLDDGTLTRTVAPTADPERPLVEAIADAHGTLLTSAQRWLGPVPAERSIVAALPLEQWPAAQQDERAA